MELAIKPNWRDGVPRCVRDSDECPSFGQRLKSDGTPRRTRRWFCAHDGADPGWQCDPAVRAMSAELVQLRKLAGSGGRAKAGGGR